METNICFPRGYCLVILVKVYSSFFSELSVLVGGGGE